MDPAGYFQMQGKSREEVLEESKPDAEQELKREAVMAAIAEAEEIEVSEEEMVEALAHTAEHERTSPEKLLERLRENGRDELVREDIRVRKAIDLVAERGEADPDRPGRGARADLDAGEGAPGRRRSLDSRLGLSPPATSPRSARAGRRARLTPSIECGP